MTKINEISKSLNLHPCLIKLVIDNDYFLFSYIKMNDLTQIKAKSEGFYVAI